MATTEKKTLEVTDAEIDRIIAGLHLYKELMAKEARAAVDNYEPSLASEEYMATCRLLAEIGSQTSHKL